MSSTPQTESKSSKGRLVSTFRRLKLRHLLFLLLLLSGIIPLLISSGLMIDGTRDVLKTQEKVLLTQAASVRAQDLSDAIATCRRQLSQLGFTVLGVPGPDLLEERLRQDWVFDQMKQLTGGNERLLYLRLLQVDGTGRSVGPEQAKEGVRQAFVSAFQGALAENQPVYRFVDLAGGKRPAAVVAVPVEIKEVGRLFALGLVRLDIGDSFVFAEDGRATEQILLFDSVGGMLWSTGAEPGVERVLLRSPLLAEYLNHPVSVAAENEIATSGQKRRYLVQVLPVPETGWGLLAHRPVAVAFQSVENMVVRALLSSLILVVLSLIFSLVAAGWLSRPIQRLTETSHEIVRGRFDQRVQTEWMGFEIAELASDFNRMSDHLMGYVEQLQRAADANRELFISSIRAFAAAIDAKDPYTRGHSERVANYSRAIARHLGLSKEIRQQVWVSAVLHDIGKIGVDDRILKKGSVLTPEEFEQMKLHPMIGAEIVAPISALSEMLPGIRWHHEAWNGTGYPDALKGERIPLMARIIGVADTFDAITTNRPYQDGYTPEYALDRIRQLTGTKFDAKIVTAFLLAWESGRIVVEQPNSGANSTAISLPIATALGGS